MESRLLEKITLANGLALELYDQSRRMTGDRWLVCLLARVEVPILPEYFSGLQNGDRAYRSLVAAHGDNVVFVQEKIRHFVDEKEVEGVLAGLLQRFKEHLAAYLGNPKFPSLYSLKVYADLQERQRWGSSTPGDKPVPTDGQVPKTG